MRLRAWVEAAGKGLQDGFQQPYEVGSSWNLDHLQGVLTEPYETHDRAMSMGQFLRAGFRSEAWRDGLWPFWWRNKKEGSHGR